MKTTTRWNPKECYNLNIHSVSPGFYISFARVDSLFCPLVTAWEWGGWHMLSLSCLLCAGLDPELSDKKWRKGRSCCACERLRGRNTPRARSSSFAAHKHRGQVRLRSFHRKRRFEEGRACGFVFLVVSDPSLHLETTNWFLTTPCFSGLLPGQVWLKYLVMAENTPWLLWQQLIYK